MEEEGEGKRKRIRWCDVEDSENDAEDLDVNQVEVLVDQWIQEIKEAGIEEEEWEEEDRFELGGEDLGEHLKAWDDVNGGELPWGK